MRETSRKLRIAPVPQSFMNEIDVDRVHVPGRWIADSANQLHADRPDTRDRQYAEEDRRLAPRPAESPGEGGRKERHGFRPITRAETMPRPPRRIRAHHQ